MTQYRYKNQNGALGIAHGNEHFSMEMPNRVSDVVDLLNAQAAKIETLNGLVDSIDALIEEEMGDWYSVNYSYLPMQMSNIGHMRDAIQEQRATLAQKAGTA